MVHEFYFNVITLFDKYKNIYHINYKDYRFSILFFVARCFHAEILISARLKS